MSGYNFDDYCHRCIRRTVEVGAGRRLLGWLYCAPCSLKYSDDQILGEQIERSKLQIKTYIDMTSYEEAQISFMIKHLEELKRNRRSHLRVVGDDVLSGAKS